jgi:hypothetical protein
VAAERVREPTQGGSILANILRRTHRPPAVTASTMTSTTTATTRPVARAFARRRSQVVARAEDRRQLPDRTARRFSLCTYS